MTLNQIIAKMKADNPTLKTGSDETGYVELNAQEYEAQILEWANNQFNEATKTAELEAAKSALLAKLGITAEEAALLLS
jgi:hypothetical protein